MGIRASLLGVAVAGVTFSAALALAQPAEAPQPGPEVEKLGYFVGAWSMEGKARGSDMGPFGEIKGRDMCRWMPGRFFVMCQLDHEGPMGPIKALGVLGFDPEKKVYTSSSFNSAGMAQTATGTFDNGTWTWTKDKAMGGKPGKSRIVMSDTTPSGYKLRWETSENGKSWRPLMTGQVTKLLAKGKEAEKKEETEKEK